MSLSFHYVIKLLSSHWQHLTSALVGEGVGGILRYFSYLEEQRSFGGLKVMISPTAFLDHRFTGGVTSVETIWQDLF